MLPRWSLLQSACPGKVLADHPAGCQWDGSGLLRLSLATVVCRAGVPSVGGGEGRRALGPALGF